MPMQTAYLTYGGPTIKLTPLYNSESARVVPVNLPASVTYAAGQLLYQASASVNAVQTITAPGSGTYTITVTNPISGRTATTTALAFGANDATVQTALRLAWVAAGGTSTDLAVSSLAVTFSGTVAARPIPLLTVSAGSVANTTPGVTAKQMTAYAGSGSPTCILEYGVTTDASGGVRLSANWDIDSRPYATAFYSGTFNCADLTGLDANAVTKMGGLLVAGTVSAGTFRF